MPYDTLVWGEEQAANGLTATAAKGPSGYVTSGDNITLKKGMGNPVLFGLGSVSDTKPQGCALVPQFSNRNTYIYGPGAMNFGDDGFSDMRHYGGKKLQPGEYLTGYVSTTNVNEGAVVAANIGYGGYPAIGGPIEGGDTFVEKITITSAAAVTFNSGAVALSSALTSSSFLDTSKNYLLVGLEPNISAATFGGIMHVANLSGAWHGFYPGIPVTPLSAVIFSPGKQVLFPEPLPLSGEEFDTVTVGMTATSAGAISTGLILKEL